MPRFIYAYMDRRDTAKYLGTSTVNSLIPCGMRILFQMRVFQMHFNEIVMDIFSASRWMAQQPIDDKSKLIQVMAWCRQAKSYYLSNVEPDLFRICFLYTTMN